MSEKFEIKDGQQGPWMLDLGTLMIPEAMELKRFTGYGPRAWVDALAEDDPLAVRFAFYLARKRAGEDELQFADVDVNLFGMSLTLLPDDDATVSPDAGVTEDNAELVPTGPGPDPTGQE
jgi:hypothetical protein